MFQIFSNILQKMCVFLLPCTYGSKNVKVESKVFGRNADNYFDILQKKYFNGYCEFFYQHLFVINV